MVFPKRYIDIAKKCTKIDVFGKIAFFGWKKAFYPKTKFVPKTSNYCKTEEKIIFLKYMFFGGICEVPKWAKNPKQPYS